MWAILNCMKIPLEKWPSCLAITTQQHETYFSECSNPRGLQGVWCLNRLSEQLLRFPLLPETSFLELAAVGPHDYAREEEESLSWSDLRAGGRLAAETHKLKSKPFMAECLAWRKHVHQGITD